jgi:hypothetical protein
LKSAAKTTRGTTPMVAAEYQSAHNSFPLESSWRLLEIDDSFYTTRDDVCTFKMILGETILSGSNSGSLFIPIGWLERKLLVPCMYGRGTRLKDSFDSVIIGPVGAPQVRNGTSALSTYRIGTPLVLQISRLLD